MVDKRPAATGGDRDAARMPIHPAMLRVPIDRAAPGMRLSLPVIHPTRGTLLLCRDYVLTRPLVRKLRELEVHEVWVRYPQTEQIRRYVSPTLLHYQGRLIGLVSRTFGGLHSEAHAPLEFMPYRRALRALLHSLAHEPLAAAYIVELGGSARSELRHAGEVCFLSLLLGLKLQDYLIHQRKRLDPRAAREVTSLGLGAMLHDIGLRELPPEVRERFDRTGDESDPAWRQHVQLGYKLLSGVIPPSAAGVILHHHQHFDGSGFPAGPAGDGRGGDGRGGDGRGLAGEEIHIFARIACVANHFDRLRRPLNGRPVPRARVLKAMLTGPLAARFDPVVLAALPTVVPAFAPGSTALLSSGERIVVTEWHPESPCQPTVQVLEDDREPSRRRRCESPRYDLRERTDLAIVEQQGEDVRGDSFVVPEQLVEAAHDAVCGLH